MARSSISSSAFSNASVNEKTEAEAMGSDQQSLKEQVDTESHGTSAPQIAGGSQSAAGGEQDHFLVTIPVDSPEHPYNWPVWQKLSNSAQLAFLALTGSAASSILAPAQPDIAAEFGISQEVTVLATSLYVAAFVIGPLFFAPISELYGRRWSLLPPMFAMGLFSVGAAVSKSVAALLVCRFFSGFFGSAPVSNVTASMSDMFAPKTRGMALACYSIVVVGGPTIFPIIGAAFASNPSLGWRWSQWLQAIISFAPFVWSSLLLKESYRPYLLVRKAAKMRKETGDSRWHTPYQHARLSVKTVLTKHLGRPVVMLATEPIVTFVAFYASFIFGILYLTLEVYPYVFGEQRGWGQVTETLPFISLFVGVLMGLVANLANQKRYVKAVEAAGGRPVPEARCPPMIIGAFLFVIGLWWFAWTASPPVPWPASVVAGVFIGAGFNILFLQSVSCKLPVNLIDFGAKLLTFSSKS
jgi:MFS family permease